MPLEPRTLARAGQPDGQHHQALGCALRRRSSRGDFRYFDHRGGCFRLATLRRLFFHRGGWSSSLDGSWRKGLSYGLLATASTSSSAAAPTTSATPAISGSRWPGLPSCTGHILRLLGGLCD